jgi:hypothetical protein
MRVLASEIRRGFVLADRDDAAADGARKLREIFLELPVHTQHGIPAGEKNVAPHGRIGGCNPGQVAKTAG